jgi:DNA-binding response OmpR family regulator
LERAFRRCNLSNRLVVLSDGREAIDYLTSLNDATGANEREGPAVMLLDLQLPHYTGLQVLAWLQTQAVATRVPVVVLSSSNQKSDQVKARELGARAYHVKPAHPADLDVLIASLAAEFIPGWGLA